MSTINKCTPKQLEYARIYQAKNYKDHLRNMKTYYNTTVDKAEKLRKQNKRRQLMAEEKLQRAILYQPLEKVETKPI